MAHGVGREVFALAVSFELRKLVQSINMDTLRIPVHVEVELRPNSTVNQADIKEWLKQIFSSMPLFAEGVVDISSKGSLAREVEAVKICDLDNQEISYWKAELVFHCYRLVDAGPEKDFLDGEDDLPACDQWELPNKMLSSLWETIVCDGDIKRTLLGYASTAMIFTNARVDPDVVSWNRMILLHGPPGRWSPRTSIYLTLAIVNISACTHTYICMQELARQLCAKPWPRRSSSAMAPLTPAASYWRSTPTPSSRDGSRSLGNWYVEGGKANNDHG